MGLKSCVILPTKCVYLKSICVYFLGGLLVQCNNQVTARGECICLGERVQMMDDVTMSGSDGIADCSLVTEDKEGICVMPDLGTIKTEQSTSDDPGTPNVAMGIKFILPNRFDMNVCSRFVKSLNEEDSKNIQDQVNSDLEVASVLFKGEKTCGRVAEAQ